MRSRRGAGPLRGISALPLRAVAAARLLAVRDRRGVERTAYALVAHAGQVLHTTTADEDDRVLLEVVTDAGDVRGDLDARGQADARDLAQRRVRLLGGGRVDARADATPLGRTLQRGSLRLGRFALPPLADELLDRGHL